MLLSSEFRPIVRLAGRDLDGTRKIVYALQDIKGLNVNLANAIVNSLRLDPKVRLGQLSDSQLTELEKSLRDIRSLGLPPWLLNRRKDYETGVEREKAIGSWRGVRHSLGLKVRGQRTRTTGRKGQTVGVRKAAVQATPAKETSD